MGKMNMFAFCFVYKNDENYEKKIIENETK